MNFSQLASRSRSMPCSWKFICWQFTDQVANLPTVGNHPTWPSTMSYGFWHCAKRNWQAANSTWPDPNHSLCDRCRSPVVRNDSKRHKIPLFWPWPLISIYKWSNLTLSWAHLPLFGPLIWPWPMWSLTSRSNLNEITKNLWPMTLTFICDQDIIKGTSSYWIMWP